MIVELDLTFRNGSSCIVIHCAACRFDNDDVGYLETILFAIFKNKPSLSSRTVVFVWKYGSMVYVKKHPVLTKNQKDEDKMTPRDLFLHMGVH